MTYYFRQKKKTKESISHKKKKQPFETNPIAKPLTPFSVCVKKPKLRLKANYSYATF